MCHAHTVAGMLVADLLRVSRTWGREAASRTARLPVIFAAAEAAVLGSRNGETLATAAAGGVSTASMPMMLPCLPGKHGKVSCQ